MPRRAFDEPIVNLILDDIEDSRVLADVIREVLRPHDLCVNGLKRDHSRGAHVDVQCAALAHELARSTLRDVPRAVLFMNADLYPAAKNEYDVIRRFAFSHQPGAARERALVGQFGKVLPFGGGQ